jgi:acyl homoserine lactone synthase
MKEDKMIEIMQSGQAGKTLSLIEMHRLRKMIFKDRMEWDIEISNDGLEIDDYDLPEAVYFLVRDEQRRAVGTWRILPSGSPSMIRNLWPKFLEDLAMPQTPYIWEASRFGVHAYETEDYRHTHQVSHVTVKLIWALIKTCLIADITHIYTLYNPQVGRSVKRIGFIPEIVSKTLPIDGKPAIVGRFRMDEEALSRIETITGYKGSLSENDLPPILLERIYKFGKEKAYA